MRSSLPLLAVDVRRNASRHVPIVACDVHFWRSVLPVTASVLPRCVHARDVSAMALTSSREAEAAVEVTVVGDSKEAPWTLRRLGSSDVRTIERIDVLVTQCGSLTHRIRVNLCFSLSAPVDSGHGHPFLFTRGFDPTIPRVCMEHILTEQI